MTVEELKKIESRHLYRKDQSDKRLTRESLEMSVPMDHETTTRLPLVALETLGMGYGFDRLYMVDLKTGKQTKLPSRYEITKATATQGEGNGVGSNASTTRQLDTYRGVKYTGRYTPVQNGLNDGGLGDDKDNGVHGMFHTLERQSGQFNSAEAGKSGSWTSLANDLFVTAYAGSGYETGNKPKNQTIHSAAVFPGVLKTADPTTDGIHLDLAGIEKLCDESNTDNLKDGSLLRGLGIIYQYLSPSAWDTIEMNQSVIADFSKGVKDIERTLDAIYNRGRSHYGVRNQDGAMHKLIISLIELGAAMRTKRFSNNIWAPNSLGDFGHLERWTVTLPGEAQAVWKKGVLNDFFWVVEDRYLIAPWWCVNQLNFYDFVDDEREREMRDIDRKDAIETLHLIFQHMDTEKGLHHGSDSTLPMLLFEKYKEGVIKDFTDYTSPEAAIAAGLMGYRTPRDADQNVQSTSAGHVGYLATLPSAHGKLLGSEKAEFLDRLNEAADHAMLASNAENFKEGMQLSSSFSYQALIGRTRFGEAHCDFRVYPGGFFRGCSRIPMYVNITNGSSAAGDEMTGINWFPLLGWNMFSPSTSSLGFLPLGENGAHYTSRLGQTTAWAESDVSDDIALWPSSTVGNESYWTPGRDQYSALLLKGTNDLYTTWMDRADTIATEGVIVPSFGAINLVAEMSYDTPHALLTRNFPILRKLYQQAGMSDAIDKDDTSFDFMSAGDNVHGSSEWGGDTPWKLIDRHLLSENSEAAHHRAGELDLMPFVYAGSTLPESWVDVFQLRDWLMFHSSLEAEPIMDAYTRNQTGNSWKNNGYLNSRLMVYVDAVQSNGDVRDVTMTPIIGSFTMADQKSTSHRTLAFSKGTGKISDGDLISMYPKAAAQSVEYETFLLDIRRIRSDQEVSGVTFPDSVHLSGRLGDNSGSYTRGSFKTTQDGFPLSEKDFIPGRGYALRWLEESSAANGITMSTWRSMFQDDIDYLDDSFVGVVSDSTLSDPTQANTYLGSGTDLVLTNFGLVYWTDKMGLYIQNAREGLEYSRAAPNFTVFDRDILDSTEARFRQMLAPWMMSTVGPMTFVGTMSATGESHASETITGESRFEVISLNTGAGASASEDADPDAEQEAAGDDNPSVEVAEKPEVE